MTKNVLLLGRRGIIVDDVRTLVAPGSKTCGPPLPERGRPRHHGAGIDLETRLEIVREIFLLSDATTVHLKDRVSGPQGFLSFVRSIPSGLYR